MITEQDREMQTNTSPFTCHHWSYTFYPTRWQGLEGKWQLCRQKFPMSSIQWRITLTLSATFSSYLLMASKWYGNGKGPLPSLIQLVWIKDD
jgi:hypothetical protein